MSIKKKLGGAVLATALGATLIGGGTFALFTSQTENAGNTFTAGTVVVNDTTGRTLASQEVNFSNLAPGDTKVLNMTVQNNGTLDEWVKIDSSLSDASKSGDLFSGANPIQLTYSADVVKLAPGETKTFDITYLFPLDAKDTYQGKSGSFKVVVDAVQARNNTKTDNSGPNFWQ